MKQNRQNSGFTLVEMLVAAAVGTIIVALSMQATLNARSVYNLDTARTKVNQNLRAAMDLLRDDTREAGERFPASFPAVEVTETPSGRELVLRKNLTEEVLPVCRDLNQGSSSNIAIERAVVNALVVGPYTVPSLNSECPAKTTSTATWEGYRVAAGGTLRVFVYDALSKSGSFMDVTAVKNANVGEDKGPTGWFTYPASADALVTSGTWSRTFQAAKQPRVYLLEERRYRLKDGTLQLVVNDSKDENDVKNVATGITAMTVNAYVMDDGVPKLMHGDGTLTSQDNWQQLAYVRVTLTGQTSTNGQSVTRTLTQDALPRNVFSR